MVAREFFEDVPHPEAGTLRMKAQVRDSVQTGSVFVPFLYDGGAVTALLPTTDTTEAPRVRLSAGG